MPTPAPVERDSASLLSGLKDELLRRREVNSYLGLPPADNIFDPKLLGVYGELHLCSRLVGCTRAQQVNEAGWDVEALDGRKIQVKTRAIYGHNRDAIHIDFKSPLADFSELYLLIVNEKLNHLSELLIPKADLLRMLSRETSGKLRLRGVRNNYLNWSEFSLSRTHS